jgi:hypothetical protein
MNSDTGLAVEAIHQVRGASVAIQAAAHRHQLEFFRRERWRHVHDQIEFLLERGLALCFAIGAPSASPSIVKHFR